MKNAIIILMIVLYFGNYHICEYFHSEDVEKWYMLKMAIYNIIIALGIYSMSLTSKGIILILLTIFNGLVINNIIDRLFFNSVKYEWDDIIVIFLVISVTYFEYKWRTKKQRHQGKF